MFQKVKTNLSADPELRKTCFVHKKTFKHRKNYKKQHMYCLL